MNTRLNNTKAAIGQNSISLVRPMAFIPFTAIYVTGTSNSIAASHSGMLSDRFTFTNSVVPSSIRVSFMIK